MIFFLLLPTLPDRTPYGLVCHDHTSTICDYLGVRTYMVECLVFEQTIPQFTKKTMENVDFFVWKCPQCNFLQKQRKY